MKRNLIINADDFGLTRGVNDAIIELAKKRIVSSTSVMTNMSYFSEIREYQDLLGIGVHLNLTAGRPVLDSQKVSTLVGMDGNFLSLKGLLSRMKRGRLSKVEVKAELNAQIIRLLELGVHPDHANTHQSLLKYPYFFRIISQLAGKHDIPAMRTYNSLLPKKSSVVNPLKFLKTIYLKYQQIRLRESGFQVSDKFASLLRIGLDYNTGCEILMEILNSEWEGTLELIVHPGYCGKERNNLGNYVHEREVELQVLSSPELGQWFNTSGIELIKFGQMKKTPAQNSEHENRLILAERAG